MVTHLAYLCILFCILSGDMHYLEECRILPCLTQYNTFLMANDYIDNLIQGSKLFPFGYHYKFTSQQIKNEIIIPGQMGRKTKAY